MYLFPNGQNIQILSLPRPPMPERKEAAPVLQEKDKPVHQSLKEIAPHLNRAQRRAKLSELAKKAKSEAAEAAKKEIAKQQKEKDRG